MNDNSDWHSGPLCPLPSDADDACVQLAHGSGGQLSQQLLQQVIYPRLGNAELCRGHDSALLQLPGDRLAFSTDSFVVKPLDFPGGDIGKLAVCGTLNDLLMAGAEPRFLSCSLILEEGLPLASLCRYLDSMATTAAANGVQVVTGDTKVVERGHGDGLYINTAGIGVRTGPALIAPQAIAAGDRILLSADIGRHGLAILAQREGLAFDPAIVSDCAALGETVMPLLASGLDLHCLRDLTRGGLAAALQELSASCGLGFRLEESRVPVSASVASGCELLGLDPLYVANEGCFIAFVPAPQAEAALSCLRQSRLGAMAALIGAVGDAPGEVILDTAIGSQRALRPLAGPLLPRIC